MTVKMRKILVVDDEPAMRHMLRLVLERENYDVTDAADATTGLALLTNDGYDIVLCDIRMPGMDGLGFLLEASRRNFSATLIMMSAYGSVDTAIECMKLGAYDYISKPFKPDEVVLTLRKAEERLRLRRENFRLREELARNRVLPQEKTGIWKSTAMMQVMERVKKVADSDSSVLISGETGTGKELIARTLHVAGNHRSAAPFVAINCSAISSGLMESELFGHVKGAFTGADREKQGLFAAAHGGTLFLDEIGELAMELQPKLLRVLQEGEIRPVGGTKAQKIDVRILTATARNLMEEVAQGRFRDDLYYRLAVIEIHIPPLRERHEDIPLLAVHFLRQIALREGRNLPVLTSSAMTALQKHLWPGNVRELENFMEKTMIFNRGEILSSEDLPWEGTEQRRKSDGDLSLKNAYRQLELDHLQRALRKTSGNRTQAAKLLEISLRALQYKLKELGLE